MSASPDEPVSSTARALAILLTVPTGFAALLYEVSWQRWLATLLGSDARSTSAVLAFFLGGLALGYALFGRWSRLRVARAAAAGRRPRLLRLYAGVEATIAAYALGFPALFAATRAASVRAPAGPFSTTLDFGLAALLVGLPAVAMGATVPLLTQALARDGREATHLHAWVYACNTLGAFVGALATGFWLIPWLGLVGVLRLGALLSGAAALGYAVLEARVSEGSLPGDPASLPMGAQPGWRTCCAAGLAVGFAMMALQTVWIRAAGLSLGASHFSFSLVVAAFVLFIALGSLALTRAPRIPGWLLPAALWVLVVSCALLYGVIDDLPYWAHLLRTRFGQTPEAFAPFHGAVFAGLAALLAVPVACSGAALPLLFDALRRSAGELGASAGRLYAWNTLGSLLGALLGGHGLLLVFDLDRVYCIAVAALVLAAAAVSRLRFRIGWARTGLLLVLPALAALATLPAWDPVRLSSGLFRNRSETDATRRGPAGYFEGVETDVVYYRDGPDASVAVHEEHTGAGEPVRSLMVNGKSDGSLPVEHATMGLLGLLPALFADRHERAFVIGWGCGVSAGELASLPGTREVVVAEISRAVLGAAPWFEDLNGFAFSHPAVRIVESDAYRSLLRSRGRFDVIVSEPSNPWVSGVEMLYSEELLRAARSRLAPGGIYAQWFHTYETDEASLELILRTTTAVFEHVALWYGLGTDLILLAFDDPRVYDLSRLASRIQQEAFRAGLARSQVHGLAALLAHELWPLGVAQRVQSEGPLHTLEHPRLGHRAARAFFVGSEGSLPPSASLRAPRARPEPSLLAAWLERPEAESEEARRELVWETCRHRAQECVTLLAWWSRRAPGSAARRELLRWIRSHPLESRQIPLDRLPELTRLYGADRQLPVDARTVLRLGRAYVDFHHHGVPFPRGELEAVRRRCRDRPGEPGSCAEAVERLSGR